MNLITDSRRPKTMYSLHPLRIIIFLLFTLVLFSGTGCVKDHQGRFPQHMMINYTADNLGTMFPCGCRIPLGGLSRRGGVIKQDSAYPSVTVDAGSFVGGNTGYDRFAGNYILKAYNLIGYDAVNLGAEENKQTVEQLREWDELTGGILVSANTVDPDGNPVTRDFITIARGGIKIAITGLTEIPTRSLESENLPVIEAPTESLTRTLQKIDNENADFIILLTDLPIDSLTEVLESSGHVDLVIQGQGFIPSRQPEVSSPVNRTRLVNIGGTGKYLGRLRLDFEPDGTITGEEPITVELDSFVSTQSEISLLLTEFKRELRDRRSEFLGDPSNPFQRSQAPELIDILTGYTGSGFCVKCHLGYDNPGRINGHTDAWSDLDTQAQTNPECLACHTTGYGIPTGLEDPFRDSHLVGITCEACHGPAAGHVREQTARREGLSPTGMLDFIDETGLPFTKAVPKSVCLRCHTEEWSPDFDYTTWLDRVKHNTRLSNLDSPPEPQPDE